MGRGTEKSPYTRKDIEKKIKEHGGSQGLNLSEKVFENGVDLSGLDLSGIILTGVEFVNGHFEGTSFNSSHLEDTLFVGTNLVGTNMTFARLDRTRFGGVNCENTDFRFAYLVEADLRGDFREANFFSANLKRANLRLAHLNNVNFRGANLDGADLRDTNLDGADLFISEITSNTKLENIEWGSYILNTEKQKSYKAAIYTYRCLKKWYTEHGIYDIADIFFYREMEAKRKGHSWKKEPHLKLWSWIIRILCGYGENPERVGISAAIIVLGLAISYFLGGTFSSSLSFLSTLYYSVVSFVAVGYGSWVAEPIGWTKYMGAVEAVIGVFMMALFLVTFTRKMTR